MIDAHSLAWQLHIGEGSETGGGRRTWSGLRMSGALARSGSDDNITAHDDIHREQWSVQLVVAAFASHICDLE